MDPWPRLRSLPPPCRGPSLQGIPMLIQLFRDLFQSGLPPEPLVRRALRRLEADFRELALLALADWHRLELVADELFRSIVQLQRPSWGHWNGLLTALREARKTTLRQAQTIERDRLRQADVLNGIL